TSLLEDGPPGPSRPALEMIRRNIEMEARLIDDLLDLTRIARGRLFLDRRRLDAHEVIGRALEICRNAVEEAGLTLELAQEATDTALDADPTRLQQIVWNLIQNAVKFTPVGGRVGVRTRNPAPADAEQGTRLIVEVS